MSAVRSPAQASRSVFVTLGEYLGPYKAHADVTPQIIANANDLLTRVNKVYALYVADGGELQTNPATGSVISGSGNGGLRPRDAKVGAPNSTHKDGQGIDTYDPKRSFASWCIEHFTTLAENGLHMEDPRWTPTWVHLQSVPPRSGKTVYIPNASPALAAAPKKWEDMA